MKKDGLKKLTAMTQREIAANLDIEETTVSRWDEVPGYAVAYAQAIYFNRELALRNKMLSAQLTQITTAVESFITEEAHHEDGKIFTISTAAVVTAGVPERPDS